MRTILGIFTVLFFHAIYSPLMAQLPNGVYKAITETSEGKTTHEIKKLDDYLVYSTYESEPPMFIKTLGGFYAESEHQIELALEFNSEFGNDGAREVSWAHTSNDDGIAITIDGETLQFSKQAEKPQDLDGLWVFGTRGPDTGQERRGDCCPRKTLKFLLDGHFQWIAYHTETMRFLGSGGGSYTGENNTYTEYIEYFSRDNSRVGAKLPFEFEIQENDWHHKGNNSKGEPMYEIWMRRLIL